jgi:hypothetical protein
MFRRYNRWHSRFDQPDPYDGSYSLTNPQSFNRYAYVQNDPVNFVDPSGLVWMCVTGDNGEQFCFDNTDPNQSVQIYADYGFTDSFFTGQFNPDMRMAALIFGNSDGPGVGGPVIGPIVPQKPSDDKDIQRRIAEGNAWDKWYAWVNCNTPIMNKYNAQIHDYLKIGGEAFWSEVGAGLAAGTAVFGAGRGEGIGTGTPHTMDERPVGAWGVVLIIVGTHYAERTRINNIKAEYQVEVTANCGSKPPHP